MAGRDDGHDEEDYRSFTRARLEDRRALFRAGRGAWYAAIEPDTGEVVGSCGVVVTGNRGRFQVVNTASSHRRRGICSRLVVEAASQAREAYGAERFVIAAIRTITPSGCTKRLDSSARNGCSVFASGRAQARRRSSLRPRLRLGCV